MGNYRFKLSDIVPNAWFYKLKDMGKGRGRSQIKKKQASSSSLSSSSSSIFSSSSNIPQTKTQLPHNLSYQRKSYYISRNLSPNSHQSNEILSMNPTSNNINFSEPPRKSSEKSRSTTRRKTSISPKCVNSTVSASCSCRASLESVWTKNGSTPEEYPNSRFSTSTTSSSEPGSSAHSPKTFNAMILSASCPCSDIVIDRNKNDHGIDSVSKIDLPPILTKPKKLEDSTNGTKNNNNNILSIFPQSRVWGG